MVMYYAAIENQHINFLEKVNMFSLCIIFGQYLYSKRKHVMVMDVLLGVGGLITLINSFKCNKREVIMYKKIGAKLLKEQMSTTNV